MVIEFASSSGAVGLEYPFTLRIHSFTIPSLVDKTVAAIYINLQSPEKRVF